MACGGGPGSTETWESVAEVPKKSTGRGLGKWPWWQKDADVGASWKGEGSRFTGWPGVDAQEMVTQAGVKQNGCLDQEAPLLPPQDETGARLAQRSQRCSEADFSRPAYTVGPGKLPELLCTPSYGNRNTVQDRGREYSGRPLVGERWYAGGTGRASNIEAEGTGALSRATWPSPGHCSIVPPTESCSRPGAWGEPLHTSACLILPRILGQTLLFPLFKDFYLCIYS